MIPRKASAGPTAPAIPTFTTTSVTARFLLPTIEKTVVGLRIYDALHKASTTRQIVGVVGSKGMGKTFQIDSALRWFHEREARAHALDQGYVPQNARVIRNLRHDTHDDVLASLLTAINPLEPTRERGRRKSPSVLRERLCTLLAMKNVAVLALDESEVARPGTIEALRDVVALSADLALSRASRGAETTALGVGVLMVGAWEAEPMFRQSTEMGQRLTQIVHLPALSIAEVTGAMTTWLPAAAALHAADAERWQAFVRVEVCQNRVNTMRHPLSIVREYLRRLDARQRLQGVTSLTEVPIDFALLSKVAADNPPPNLPEHGKRGRDA